MVSYILGAAGFGQSSTHTTPKVEGIAPENVDFQVRNLLFLGGWGFQGSMLKMLNFFGVYHTWCKQNSYRINWTNILTYMKEGTELTSLVTFESYECLQGFFYTPDFFGSEICFGTDSRKVKTWGTLNFENPTIPTNKKGTFTGVIK